MATTMPTTRSIPPLTRTLPADIAQQIKQLGREYGFSGCAITHTRLDQEHQYYQRWIEQNFHGEMSYMERNIDKRLAPEKLVEQTLSVICLRMDYLTQPSEQCIELLDHPDKAYISRYALGRDYHKLIRKRLQKMAQRLGEIIGEFGYRVFTDSAPVLEKALAVKAGLGWRGKHSNLLNRAQGSWFFLGEIFTDLPLPADAALTEHCGECTACIDKCPTQAIVKPYVVDARRCISYLTIEHHSAIPLEFRKAIGNRIYGCDDCQLYCPWNRFEQLTDETDFSARHGLDDISLLDCFSWNEQQFLDRFAGSPIRRIGYDKWRSNIAIALGNAAASPHIKESLNSALSDAGGVLAEHIQWALQQQSLPRKPTTR
jgi:epoxyqueuosine reductase